MGFDSIFTFDTAALQRIKADPDYFGPALLRLCAGGGLPHDPYLYARDGLSVLGAWRGTVDGIPGLGRVLEFKCGQETAQIIAVICDDMIDLVAKDPHFAGEFLECAEGYMCDCASGRVSPGDIEAYGVMAHSNIAAGQVMRFCGIVYPGETVRIGIHNGDVHELIIGKSLGQPRVYYRPPSSEMCWGEPGFG